MTFIPVGSVLVVVTTVSAIALGLWVVYHLGRFAWRALPQRGALAVVTRVLASPAILAVGVVCGAAASVALNLAAVVVLWVMSSLAEYAGLLD